MGTFFLTLDANAVYTADAPVIDVLVDGVVVSSITIDSGFGLSSYSFEFAGTYPSTFSLNFNDGSTEIGRVVTVNNAYINGTNVNSNLDLSVLTQGLSANVATNGIADLFGQTELTLANLGAVTLQGDALMNKLIGTAAADVIDGGDNNDNIKGFDGNDQLHGGGGNDIIRGGIGDDILLGADGNDILKGEDGNDTLVGGTGSDLLDGGAGDDILNGGAENDTIRAGAGADIAFGGSGNDRLFGDDGDDLLSGGSGNDLIEGGIGNDTLEGNSGMDVLRGEDGDDRLDGGADNDQVYGGAGNDIVYGGDGWDRVEGNDGTDTLYGGLGSDTVLGGAGADTVYGEDGNDRVRGGDDNDFVYGGEGNDQVFGDAGDDQVWGGNGNDLVNGNEGDDILYGEAGFDKIFGHEGNDTIYGGDDNDRIFGNQGNDIINGDDGADTLYASSVHETVTTTSTVVVSLLNESFDSGTGSFTYSDGGFGGTDPGGDNASGSYVGNDGNIANGSLEIFLDGATRSTETNISGSWDATFNVADDATGVTLDFAYQLFHAGRNDNGEDVTVYVEIDGIQYGVGGNSYIAEAYGSGGTTDTGWVTVSLDLADLAAGSHTISLGGIKNSKNRGNEDSRIDFDDIAITGGIEVTSTGLNVMDEGAVNILNGGAGADTLYGSSGYDTLNGGADNDRLYSGTTAVLSSAIDDILANNSGLVYNEASGSFYQFVSGTDTYAGASSAALSSTIVGLDGVNGYLANITSQAEQDFVWGLTGNTSIWGGASDATTEGQWAWEDGSENGLLFWSGNGTGSAVGGLYNNWIVGQEPWDGGDDYDWFILRAANGGQWYTENSTVTYGYVIEYDATTLTSSIGTNTLNGGTGTDDLYGSIGKDIFVFDNTDDIDDIFGFNDAIDVIDINDVISYNSGSDVLSEFVQVTTVGGNTEIAVDADGTGGFTTIASIDGVTGLDLATLVANASLIVE